MWRTSPARTLGLERPALMAIVNVTPDSFFDGGVNASPDAAAAAAERAIADGAVALDVGGESTRPGAQRVPADEQIRRVVPAIRAIRARVGDTPVITVDTTLAAVAAAALDAGADAVNDVSAGLEDGDMLPLVARLGRGIILMHRLRPPALDSYSDRYEAPPAYADVVEDVRAFLAARVSAALAAGVAAESIVLDPGLGFGKSVEQNLALIAGTPRLAELGAPILSGLSRKSFVARAGGLGPDTRPADRLEGTLTLSVAHYLAGARIFRVHDVAPHARALAAAAALTSPPAPSPECSR